MLERTSLSPLEKIPHELLNYIMLFLDSSETPFAAISKEITFTMYYHPTYIVIEGMVLNKRVFDFFMKLNHIQYEDDDGDIKYFSYLKFYKDEKGNQIIKFSNLVDTLIKYNPEAIYQIMTDPGFLSIVMKNHPEQCVGTTKSFINMFLSGFLSLLASSVAIVIYLPIVCLTTLLVWMIFPVSLCYKVPFSPRLMGGGILGVPFGLIYSMFSAMYYGYHTPVSLNNTICIIQSSFKMIYEICFARYWGPFSEDRFINPWDKPLSLIKDTFADIVTKHKPASSTNTAKIIQKLKIKKSLQLANPKSVQSTENKIFTYHKGNINLFSRKTKKQLPADERLTISLRGPYQQSN